MCDVGEVVERLVVERNVGEYGLFEYDMHSDWYLYFLLAVN